MEAFKEAVMKKASVMNTTGDAIAILNEVSCLSPRGNLVVRLAYVQLSLLYM